MGKKKQDFGAKISQIIDRRVGERNSRFSAAEKAEKRFMLQRKKLYRSKNRFNLTENQVSYEGFPSEFKKAPFVESDGEEYGNIGADLVTLANFGGGSFENPESGVPKCYKLKRAEALANIIAASKKAKATYQMEKEAQLNKLQDMDELFVKLQMQGNFNVQSSTNRIFNDDSYDSMYRTLQLNDSKRAEACRVGGESESKQSRISGELPTSATNINKESEIVMIDGSSSKPEIDREDIRKKKQDKSGRRNMKQKLQREMRGAMKELRKDAMYLAKVQSKQRHKASQERNKKVKDIIQSLQGQESEYMKRKLKKN